MDLPNKEELLAKYWAGETSPAEDAGLKKLCQDHPDQFSAEERLFLNGLNEMSSLKLPADFDESIKEKIADLNAENSMAGTAISNEIGRGQAPLAVIKFFKPLFRIAAALLLLLSIGWGMQQWSDSTSIASKFEDKETELAFQEAQEALLLIASKMSKVKSVTQALGKFESTHDKIKSITPN